MSSENSELVREAYEALRGGDLGPSARSMSPDVTWRAWEPGSWDCENRNQVLMTLRARIDDDHVGPIKELVDLDEERVLLVMEIPADSEATRAALGLDPDQEEIANLVTIRDRQVVSMQDYRSKADALRSVRGAG